MEKSEMVPDEETRFPGVRCLCRIFRGCVPSAADLCRSRTGEPAREEKGSGDRDPDLATSISSEHETNERRDRPEDERGGLRTGDG